MLANPAILQMKYARIVKLFAEQTSPNGDFFLPPEAFPVSVVETAEPQACQGAKDDATSRDSVADTYLLALACPVKKHTCKTFPK